MTRKLIALLLCICMIGSMTVYAVDDVTEPTVPETTVAATEPEVTEPETTEPEVTEPEVTEPEVTEPETTEPVVTETITPVVDEAQASVSLATPFEQIIAGETTEEMYLAMLGLMETDMDGLLALTFEEIQLIEARLLKLDSAKTSQDTIDALDTLTYLPNYQVNATCPDCGQTGDHKADCPRVVGTILAVTTNQTWQGQRFTSHSTQELGNGAVVTLRDLTADELENRKREANFVVPDGITLTIKGHGTFKRGEGNKNSLIYVEKGGTLIIEGTSKDQPLILDGGDVLANYALIRSEGTVTLKNAVIRNGKNRSVSSNGAPNGLGGGIQIAHPGTLKVENSVITKNTVSKRGGGIYSTGAVEIINSEISYNRAMSTETGTPHVNAGRGGGFYVGGENASITLTDSLVTENAAMYYGGGGQICSKGVLTMNGNTVFSKNQAILHGAGALHVTDDATFTMNGGSMENNFAQYVGGAIHSSYSCVLNLNSGTIKDNTCNGRGAGVHVNTGGAITLGENITISGNKAYKEPMGTSADVSADGYTWSNVKYEGSNEDFGYGGGVLIDSGTCTVAGATIKDNYAEVGGGGIALTMLNMGGTGLKDYMVINFSMTSGQIKNNTTDGDGAGVYIMTNKAKENMIKAFGPEDSEAYQNALASIDANNIHGFTAKQILEGIPYAMVSGGMITDNVAADNGGGLFLGEKTHFEITGGSISENTALNGAGVYVQTGTADIKGGTISENEATNNGGALYVSGTVNMTAGEVKDNTSANGAGAFVKGGDFTMTGGSIDNNDVPGNGGGLYVDDGNFYMISGTLSNNDATGSTSYGGGAYVTGGNVVIGAENCAYDDPDGNHKNTAHDDKTHPVVTKNSAKDSGGGLAVVGDGSITMYCGKIVENDATNRGRGLNVYMEKGTFTYKKGDLGSLKEPELVIVGGKFDVGEPYIKLDYYHCNDPEHSDDHATDSDLSVMHATATEDKYINLPDGEKYWDADEGFRFFGWTFFGPNEQGAKSNVRKKTDYKAMGEPIIVKDIHDSINTDGTISMYALWAPEVSDITYKGVVVNGEYTEGGWTNNTENPATYKFEVGSNIVTLKAPVKAGYTFTGWYIYQDLNQNANWGYEPVFKTTSDTSYSNLDFTALKTNGQFLAADADGSYALEMGTTYFGDITLVAEFERAYTDLLIDKAFPANADTSIDENQTFIFEITGVPYDNAVTFTPMTVVIEGDGEISIKDLPVGEYTITEKSGWSWRYSPDNAEQKITLSDVNEDDYKVTFMNTRTEDKWLSGDSFCKNMWINLQSTKSR